MSRQKLASLRAGLKNRGLRLALSAALLLTIAASTHGEGYLSFPPARNVLYDGGSYGKRAIQMLNAGGAKVEYSNGHGLCGDWAGRREFTSPHTYGAGPPLFTFSEGSKIDINVTITQHQYGYFEFRLCVPDDGGLDLSVPITQSCLNKHVLEFDEDYVNSSYNDVMESGRSSPADYEGNSYSYSYSSGEDQDYLVQSSKNFKCESLSSRNPDGSCCNNGGTCSSASNNIHRWVVPNITEGAIYTMRYKLPENVTCDRCVLQWYHQTGDESTAYSTSSYYTRWYPEGFWNCADIAIVSGSSNSTTGTQSSKSNTTSFVNGREIDESMECWSVNSSDHDFCRFYACSDPLVSANICTTDRSQLVNVSGTTTAGISDQTNTSSIVVGASVAGAIGVAFAGVLYYRRRPVRSNEPVQAIPVMLDQESGTSPPSAKPAKTRTQSLKNAASDLMRMSPFGATTTRTETRIMFAKEVETVVIASPVSGPH